MIHSISRHRLGLVAAGFLILVAAASFLILGLGGGSTDPADLPVVQIAQRAEATASDSALADAGDMTAGDRQPTSGVSAGSDDAAAGGFDPAVNSPPASSPDTSADRGPSSGTTGWQYGRGAATTQTTRAQTPGYGSTSTTEVTTGEDDPVSTSTTTTAVRQTVTGGVRVQSGPGTTQGGEPSAGGTGSQQGPDTGFSAGPDSGNR